MRLGVRTDWAFASERFGREGTPTASKPEPLGADFTRILGAEAFDLLTPARASLASLLGSPVDELSAGSLRTTMDHSVVTTPLTLDVGLTDRLTLSIAAPYLKTRNDVTVYANTPPGTANVGLNPGLLVATAKASNALVVTQITAATTRLGSELTRCQQNSDPTCAAINNDRTGAAALLSQAAAAATSIGRVYGTSTVRGSVLAPLATSDLHKAVGTRLGALATQFGAFLGSPANLQTWIDARPAGSVLMAHDDLQTILSDSAVGITGVPLGSVERSHLGDVSIGGKFLLFDSTRPTRGVTEGAEKRGGRVSVSALYRLGMAQVESADDFADIGTGDGQADIEVAAYADAVFSPHFWASMVARYALQQADELPLRIGARPGDPFPPIHRRQLVQRNLGDAFSIDLTPRWSPSEQFSVAGTYRYWRKAADDYRGSFNVQDPTGAAVTLDASALNAATSQVEQRIGGAVTYSTLAAWQRRKALWPMEVTVLRWRSFAGSNTVTKFQTTAVGIRFYSRLFGAPVRPPAPRQSPTLFPLPKGR